MAAKGLTKTDDTAYLNVDYQTAISKVEKWQRYEDWSAHEHQKKVVIDVGTPAIDIYDRAAKRLVWTGRANKTLNSNSSEEDRKKNLDKAAKALLANFLAEVTAQYYAFNMRNIAISGGLMN